MKDVKLGRLIEGNANRDAIHIAIAPVIAGEHLKKADIVKLNAKCEAVKADRYDGIGIVDPFLTLGVSKGEKFWLCLYQQTVTGMRHVWEHPAFTDEEAKAFLRSTASEEWIAEYAHEIGVTKEELMEGAKEFLEKDEYFSRGPLFDGVELNEEFWTHYEAVTGKKGSGSFFSCAC